MKPFIVFIALMIINTGFLAFHTDMTRYEKLQVYLKAAAEEGACGSALYQDEEAYGRGVLAIKKADAEAFAAFYIGQTQKELGDIGGSVDYRLEIFDDEKGYKGCEAYGLAEGVPAVRLSLKVSCRDLFRLPFLSVTSVKRSAVYQWENRLTNSRLRI